MNHHDRRLPGNPPPAPQTALAPAERLLITSLMAWAQARSHDQPTRLVAETLAARASARAAALFSAWVQAIEAGGLRPLQAQCPHCGGAGPDVQRLVVACGIAPVDLDLGRRLLAPIVRDPGPVTILGRSLNAALAASGWPLPARLGPPAAEPPPVRPRTLH
jgi:hypothetical protein